MKIRDKDFATGKKEFAGRYNVRPLDTIVQMEKVFTGMVGKRLRYTDLVS